MHICKDPDELDIKRSWAMAPKKQGIDSHWKGRVSMVRVALWVAWGPEDATE